MEISIHALFVKVVIFCMLMELDQLVLVVALMELLLMLIIHAENVILSVKLALLSSLASVAN